MNLLTNFSISAVRDKINELVSAWNRFSLVAGRGIRISKRAAGYVIEALSVSHGGAAASDDYTGYLKVVCVTGNNGSATLSVINGRNQDSNAGYAYYNLDIVSCPQRNNITVKEGFLLLAIDESHAVSYVIEDNIPSQTKMTSTTGSTVSYYPLAYIRVQLSSSGSGTGSGSGTSSGVSVTVQQISRYEIPHLFCWAPCDDESSSSGSGTGTGSGTSSGSSSSGTNS